MSPTPGKHQVALIPLWVINLIGFCCALALSVSLVYWYSLDSIVLRQQTQAQAARKITPPQELSVNPFENLALAAKAAIVYNPSVKQVVYGFNEELQLPLASLTKLMTALVAEETVPPYMAVTILPLPKEADVQLHVGEKWSLTDLLSYTLTTSSNSGANSIAAAVSAFLDGQETTTELTTLPHTFIEVMNQKVAQLSLMQTYFLNSTGLDTTGEQGGAYGSAKDLALLLAEILKQHPQLLAPTTQTENIFIGPDGRKIIAHNTNVIAANIPGLVGSKTGLTDLAGGNLAIVFDASFGEPFIVVVLGSSAEERFTDIQTLVQATITYLGSAMQSSTVVDPLTLYH